MKTHIVIHHSLTKDSETVSWGAIKDFHVNVNGWNDIGYHFGLELARDRYEIFMGRMTDEVGAHCPQNGMNTKGIGICLVGNFDIEKPSKLQYDKLIVLVKFLMRQYNIPKENISGHHDHNPGKSCPGKLFDMKWFKDQL